MAKHFRQRIKKKSSGYSMKPILIPISPGQRVDSHQIHGEKNLNMPIMILQPLRYDVDNHFWQEEEAVSGLRQADMDADDLAAIREMERQLQLEDAAKLEAKYHSIEEPSNVLREQGNVETNRQGVLGDSEATPRTPQENRATDLEGRATGSRRTSQQPVQSPDRSRNNATLREI